tara:strand:+ start:313 stop:558 length:246 start_codon:yes stop_codon:yes gene_type:complete
MKTFQQFNENLSKRVNKFIEKEVLDIPAVSDMTTDLKNQNINFKKLKELGNNKRIKNLPNLLKNFAGNELKNFGNKLTTDK